MNIVSIVFGNICSLLAMGTDSISSSRKTVSGMLWVQNASQLLYGISSMVLKGYSGTAQNVVCIIRNLTIIKGINNKFVQWCLIIAGVVLGLCFNNLGVMGLLPIIANLQYTLAVFHFKNNERAIKISFLINALLFAFFCAVIWNFVGICTNLVVAVITATFLIKTKQATEK